MEEEGLFRGTYPASFPAASNTACLPRLVPLLELGLRPTLFCAHGVLASDGAWAPVENLAARWPLEIGAHLHHWNTPPLAGSPRAVHRRVPSQALSDELFAAKLETVLEGAARRAGKRPRSFRMGRWDLLSRHWPLLARAGILADASVRPLHAGEDGAQPDHFAAPARPYRVRTEGREIFELPLTVTPLPLLPVQALAGPPKPPAGRSLSEGLRLRLRNSLRFWGALALLPVYHPLPAMKAVTRLFLARGGRVLSLTWHSSEFLPGANPALPGKAAVDALCARLRDWLVWLRGNFDVRCCTLDELRRLLGASAPLVPGGPGDWRPAADSSSVRRAHA